MENAIKMFFMPFDVDVKSVPTNTQIDLIELKSNLDLKAIFLSQMLLEFYKACLPRTRVSKILKSAHQLICLFESAYLHEKFFSKPKYGKF